MMEKQLVFIGILMLLLLTGACGEDSAAQSGGDIVETDDSETGNTEANTEPSESSTDTNSDSGHDIDTVNETDTGSV